MLDLYHAEPVANSMKTLLCRKEEAWRRTSHYGDLLRCEQHSEDFVKLNPNGQVPVLVHDGTVITESTVINEYLEDAFPEVPLRPKNLAERAQMRVWSKFVDEYFCSALSMWGWHFMVRRVAPSLRMNELEKVLGRMTCSEHVDRAAAFS